MDNKIDRLPHQVLLDCEILLQEIGEKYPEALETTFNSLKDIECRWRFIRDIQNGVPYTEEMLDSVLEELENYKND